MVRDNWQTKVENADARRKESKQRKQRSEEKRIYKGWAQDLLQQLDGYYASYLDKDGHHVNNGNDENEIHKGGDTLKKKQQQSSAELAPDSKMTLHVWSEADNSTKSSLLDLLSSDKGGGGGDVPKRKARSVSAGNAAEGMNSSSSKSGRKGRGRSGSLGGWSGSIGEAPQEDGGGGRKGRGRSESFGGSGKNKKVHPRSKELSIAVAGEDAAEGPLLCKKDFFHGKCSGGNSCRHVHYSSLSASSLPLPCSTGISPLTLSTVLKKKSKHELGIKAQVKESETAAISSSFSQADSSTLLGAMDLVTHTAIDLSQLCAGRALENGDDDDDDDKKSSLSSLSELVTTTLSSAENQVPLSSIVYVVLHETIVYDRNRNGVLTMPGNEDNDEEEVHRAGGEGSAFKRRSSSIGSEYDQSEGNGHSSSSCHSRSDFHLLPGPVLEHILTFLPDTAVAACSQTCKAWYHEIGQNSPNLWLHLLQRRQWPLPSLPSIQKIKNVDEHAEISSKTARTLREEFLKHYRVMRDARALGAGILALSSSNSNTLSNHGERERQKMEKEIAFVDFGKQRREISPKRHDTCVALLEWSPKRVLAGYANECALRLFEAVPSSSSGATGASATAESVRCKEIVYQSVDPLACTKRRTSVLKAVALDEDRIGCLCRVTSPDMSNRSQGEEALLVVLDQETFLLGDTSAVVAKGGFQKNAAGAAANLKVIEIVPAIMNYVLSSDVANHQLLPVLHYVSDGGDVDDIHVKTSWHLVACGYGRFLLEVTIDIPIDDEAEDDDDDDDRPPGLLQHVARKLVLFSADAGAIVWMGESYPMHDSGDAVLASTFVRQSRNIPEIVQQDSCAAPTGSTMIAVRSEFGPAILVLEIDTTLSGEFSPWYQPHVVQESCLVRDELLIEHERDQARAAAEGDRVEWNIYPSEHMVVTPTDIVTVDNLQRRYLPNADGNDQNDAQEPQRIRHRKSILSFYPLNTFPMHDRPLHETLTLSGMLWVKDMVSIRNEHVLLICSELHSERMNSDNHHHLNGNQQEQEPSPMEEANDEEGNYDDSSAGGESEVGSQVDFVDILDITDFDIGDLPYVEESLVLVVVDVRNRCEIGRVSLRKTTTSYAFARHDRDDCYWKPKLLSTVAQDGAIAVALDAAGIVLTGDTVRSIGRLNAHAPDNGDAGDDSKSPSAATKKKKNKKIRRSAGGKKDGFARGITLRG